MREILFRGISEVTDEWVYGYLVKTRIKGNEYFSIVPYDNLAKTFTEKRWFQVIPETVGQFTGLTDKDNKRIFEGDIIKNTWTGDVHTVDWCVDCAVWVLPCVTDERRETTFNSYSGDDYMIIGNVHDNPELLKGGAE